MISAAQLEQIARLPAAQQQRFWEQVSMQPGGGCWLYRAQDKTTPHAPPRFLYRGQSISARLLAYVLVRGAPTAGFSFSSSCPPACINPNHQDLYYGKGSPYARPLRDVPLRQGT